MSTIVTSLLTVVKGMMVTGMMVTESCCQAVHPLLQYLLLMKLIETLRRKQLDLGLNDARFSEMIGVSRPTWWLIRNGQRNPGVRVLRGALREFPEFGPAVYDYIAGN